MIFNETVDVLTFCKNFLGKDLYPWQSLVLKMFYMGEIYNEKLSISKQECEMIKNDIKNKITREQIFDKMGNKFNEMVLVAGRRSSKDFMLKMASLYEVYKLIENNNLYEFYNLENGEIVNIFNLLWSQQVCNDFLMSIVNLTSTSSYFSDKIDYESFKKNYSIRFFNKNDKNIGAVRLISAYKTEKGTGNVAFATVNEFPTVDYDGKIQDIKNSMIKSGRIIYTGTPRRNENLEPDFLYDLYLKGLEDENTIVFQFPSYILNLSLDKEIIDKEREAAIKSEKVNEYLLYIEAEFLEQFSLQNPKIITVLDQ